MCGFCGCGMGRSEKRPLQEEETGKTRAAIRIVEVATRPKETSTAGAGSDEESGVAFAKTAVEGSASGAA